MAGSGVCARVCAHQSYQSTYWRPAFTAALRLEWHMFLLWLLAAMSTPFLATAPLLPYFPLQLRAFMGSSALAHTHALALAYAHAPTCSLMRAADYLNAATSEVETVSECYEHIFIAVEKFAHFCFNIILILCIVPEATPVILLLSDTSKVCLALQLSMCTCLHKRVCVHARSFPSVGHEDIWNHLSLLTIAN